jgi:UDP-N-acetylmuramate--alanine ligase
VRDVDGRNTRFDFTVPVPAVADLGRVHLIAIGGAGMSAVARLLLARGVPVSGSDAKDSPVLQALRAEGARVDVGHDAAHVNGAGTVVISSAIREDNVELVAARARGLRVFHRAQALASTMAGHRRLAVAGANGKTTTTAMLTTALDAAGQEPSFASGGELADRGTNAHWQEGSPFVVEADESDGSFLVYRPHVAVVTNVQPDHLDFYGTFERVEQAYAAFAASTPPTGLVIVCADDEGSARLGRAVAPSRRVLTYGRSPHADLRIVASEGVGTGSRSTLRDARGREHRLTLATPGDHNVLNACAAYLAAVEGSGADPEAVLAGLAGFGGARRRFDIRGEVDGVTVVDDYAHNPGKVAAVVATAAGIARARGGRVLAIFQPHLFSRTRDFAEGFARGLAPADDITLLEVYGAREEPLDGVSSELIADPLRTAGGTVAVRDAQGAVDHVVGRARPGDLILTIGAGDVTALAARIVAGLEAR